MCFVFFYFRNVNEHGFPMFQNDPSIDECALSAGEEWSNLYTQIYDTEGNLNPVWVDEGEYVPGVSETYDECVYQVCISNNPGCECGKSNNPKEK